MDRFRRHITNPILLLCWFAATALTTIMGPFGTFTSMPMGERLIYWGSLNLVSIVVAYVIRLVIVEWLPPMSRTRRDLLMPFAFSAVFTPFLQVLNHDVLHWENPSQLGVIGVFVFNLIVAGVITFMRRIMGFAFLVGMEPRPEPARQTDAEVEPASAGPARPRLYARIGGGAERILRLTVDDHYVIVTLADGARHRLLMRFADAVDEMEGQDGFLTHRSHWVSADAVVRPVRVSGRDGLELVDGTVVPVSRTYRGRLATRGLAADDLAVGVPSE